MDGVDPAEETQVGKEEQAAVSLENLVGACPYTAASFGLPTPTQREGTRCCKVALLTSCSYTVKSWFIRAFRRVEPSSFSSRPARVKGVSRYPLCPVPLRGPG
jgi:hypothetical protein